MIKHKTNKQKHIESSAVARRIIRNNGNFSEDQYGALFLEMGCRFLEQTFEDPKMEDVIDDHKFNPKNKFWKWWKSEWMCLENLLLTNVMNGNSDMDATSIEQFFNAKIKDQSTLESFYNHCKFTIQ